jgi:hypothetical protein
MLKLNILKEELVNKDAIDKNYKIESKENYGHIMNRK